MATGQLWLFPPMRPLVERLGEIFFRQIPSGPGVYLMCGTEAGVLYVGSAKNLHRRLGSYRVANPERMSRRTIRLLNRVRRIEFDLCASEAAARAREELLICVLAPPFNRAGKVWPASRRSVEKFSRCGKPPDVSSLAHDQDHLPTQSARNHERLALSAALR